MKVLTALFLLLTAALPARATSLLPLSIEQLSSRADLIFYAEVISNEVKQDPRSGQIVTITTFNVLDLIKGRVNGDGGKTHTIKQLGGKLPGSRQRLMVHGVPDFVPGRQYVVFLPPPSRLGFCSPLGLNQGSFAVIERNGTRFISNGNTMTPTPGSNSRLPLATVAGDPSQARLDNFINTVKSFSGL